MNAPDSKRQLDYPAAHSMDSYWFALDDAGEVAFMRTDLEGPLPLVGRSIDWWTSICEHLDKDEFGIPVFPVEHDLFPDGMTTSGLDQVMTSLPETVREIVFRLAIDREIPNDEKDRIITRKASDPEFSEMERSEIFQVAPGRGPQCVIWLARPADIELVFHNSDEPAIRLDPERPIYHVHRGLLDIIGLHLQQRVLAVRILRFNDDDGPWPHFLWSVAEVYGIYLFEGYGRPYLHGDNISAEYERVWVPTQARTGLPGSCMNVPARLPGVRFAQQDSIKVDDIVECYHRGEAY